jgi:hypothetical protein
MRNGEAGSRPFVIRGAVLFSAALAFGCGSKSGDASTTNGPLILQASGGPAGAVAAEVVLDEPGVGQERTCAVPVVAGACQLVSCQLGGIGSPGMGYGDFGPISATVDTTTVALTYGGFGYGTVYFPSTITLETGGTMMFRGGGGAGLPPFDVSAIIPGLAVITDGSAALIDTSQDLSVTWQPISIGQITFELDGGGTSVGELAVSVACTFDGTSGSGVVPQALLSSLKTMSGTNTTYAGLTSELDAMSVVDGLTVVTQSYQSAATPAHNFEVTLQ